MNQEMFDAVKSRPGFIAALDQSGGSSPKALKLYGVDESQYSGDDEMFDRMQTGRLKVFSHLNDWFQEFNLYHRQDGLIVKKDDDLISATRYGVMMRRHAVVQNKTAPVIVQRRAQGWMS